MTAPTPLISVVMPVWNAGAYLAPAIDSILGQSFGDFELIAVDDGSTDGSAAVLAAAAARDARVRVIAQENAGVAAALNAGIAAARGTYVARMDADDIARPDRFALQIARLKADPDLVALGGQILLIDPEGRALRQLVLPTAHDAIDAKHLGAHGMGMCHPTAMIRTAALRQVGGYDAAHPGAEDIDLWLKLAEIGRLANLEEIVLNYRQHFVSVGYRKRYEQLLSAWTYAQAAAARRGLPFDAPAPTRDSAEAVSTARVAERWGWWALGGGEIATARRYAWQLLARHPFNRGSWRLAYCALRGR